MTECKHGECCSNHCNYCVEDDSWNSCLDAMLDIINKELEYCSRIGRERDEYILEDLIKKLKSLRRGETNETTKDKKTDQSKDQKNDS